MCNRGLEERYRLVLFTLGALSHPAFLIGEENSEVLQKQNHGTNTSGIGDLVHFVFNAAGFFERENHLI